MGLLVRAMEERFHPSQEPPKWLLASASGWETATGVHVTPENALQVTAVLACVRVLAESVASLPLVVYQRLPGGGKRRATDHYLYPLLHNQPNPEMTSLEFRETKMGHLLTWGNAYGEIELDGFGRVRAVWPLRPDRMKVRRRQGQLQYLYRLPESVGGNEITLPKELVFHVKGLGFDGLVGYSPVSLARQAIALAMATEEYGARFFGNDATPGLVLQHPGKLKPAAEKNIRESWQEEYGPLKKKHRMAILEEGMKAEKIGFPPEDSQFLQTRRFQVAEIARIYNVPPHKIADLERATFSNIEHQAIDFVTGSVRTWLVRWEQAILRDLFTAADRREFFAEFLVDALLRGDTQTRYQAYATARQWGWFNANDIRELENQNPIKGGDVYLVPLNMIPADQAGAGVRSLDGRTVSADPHGEQRARQAGLSRRRLATAYQRVFADAARRVVRREIQDVREGARKHFRQRGFAEFSLWLETFYEEHKDFILRQMAPAFNSYAEVVAAAAADEVGAEPEVTPELEQFVGEYGEAYASRHVGSSIGQVRQVAREAVEAGRDPIEALDERFAEWEERRPDKVAQWETIRANNAVARFVFLVAGIARLRWNAQGENCPYCSRLNGKVIGIQGNFLSAGESFQPSGADVPLVNDHDVGHPPAHEGCDCMVTAEGGRSRDLLDEPRSERGAEASHSLAIARVLAMNAKALEALGQVVVGQVPAADMQPVADAMERGMSRMGEAIDGLKLPAPEVRSEPRIEVPAADMQPVADAMERGMGRVGEAIAALNLPAPEVKVEAHIEPAPVTVVNQPTYPKRMKETQKVRRRDGQITEIEGEREYFER